MVLKINDDICGRNYNCTKTWDTISERFVDKAISFLKDQVRLCDLVRPLVFILNPKIENKPDIQDFKLKGTVNVYISSDLSFID